MEAGKETVLQFVIPAKTRAAGASRNPEICEMIPFSWIPLRRCSIRPELMAEGRVVSLSNHGSHFASLRSSGMTT
jgi:hypothetical protein